MHTEFWVTMMVLKATSIEGHIMLPYIFLQGLRVNAAGYIDVLKMVFKLWIDKACNKKPSARLDPSYKAISNPGLVNLNMWPLTCHI